MYSDDDGHDVHCGEGGRGGGQLIKDSDWLDGVAVKGGGGEWSRYPLMFLW